MMSQFEVVLNALQQWRQYQFGTTDPNDSLGGDAADPDGDGLSNLEEYATGSDPKVANVARVPQLGRVTVSGSTYLTISYRMLTSATAAVTYSVEGSVGNLTGWSPIDVVANLVAGPVDQGDGTAMVTLRGNTRVGPGKDFLGLRLTPQ
jgi:hypothetical protein